VVDEVKRTYDVSGRRQRALERRRAVLVAAQQLFERHGFRSTTLAAVADRAGVSVKGLYNSFGSKAELAKAVFDLVIAGDDQPVAVAERTEHQGMRDEPDVRRKIKMFVDGLVRRQQRSAKVQILIRDGRHVDDSLVRVWDQLAKEALTGASVAGKLFLDTGQLCAGIELEDVRDVLWNYFMIDGYERLVLHRGWTLQRYADWLTKTLIDALCA